MSTKWFFATRLIYAAIFSLTLADVNVQAADKAIKLEAQLVFGTNEAMTNARPISPQIEKKLKGLPLKWSRYFVIGSQKFSLAKDEDSHFTMGGSDMILKNLGGQRVELTMIDRGKIIQSLRKGQTIVTNVKDENSFIVLQQVD
jgi:hypothetical protein